MGGLDSKKKRTVILKVNWKNSCDESREECESGLRMR